MDEQGAVQWFNPAAEGIFGYEAADVLGRNINILMPEPYHGEHDGYLANFRHTGHRRIIGIGREVVGRRSEGSTFPMDLAVSEFRLDGVRYFTGIVRDVSERKGVEEALKANERQFRALTETLPQLVWRPAPTSQRVYKYPVVRLHGRRFIVGIVRTLVGRGSPSRRLLRVETEWRNALATGELLDTEYRLRRHDGVYRWFKTRGVPIREVYGGALHWFGTCTDIHEQKRAEEGLERRVAERTAELAEANEAVRDSERRFRAIFDSTFQFVGLSAPDGTLLEANQTALDFAEDRARTSSACLPGRPPGGPYVERPASDSGRRSRRRLRGFRPLRGGVQEVTTSHQCRFLPQADPRRVGSRSIC